MQPPSSTYDGRLQSGIVIKKITGQYNVFIDGGTIVCSLSGRLNPQDHSAVVVGDAVQCLTSPDGAGLITAVAPRRNWVSRRSAVPMPSAHPYEQVIAANVDQVIPVLAAASPAPKWNLLDRYLVSAEASGLPALVVITKADLAGDDGELPEIAAEYRRIGYPFLLVSSVSGQGLEELRQALAGKVSVLMGKSGVGKSSLLNALQPGLGLRVNTVSRIAGKGRHTTTHLEMFSLDLGVDGQPGQIVDTPGMREFGLWGIDTDDLAFYFPEMRPFLGSCRFGMGCRHDSEPGCAIRRAVMAGDISPRRYQNLMHLREEL